MKAHLILIFLFASTFSPFVKSKPYEKLALTKSTAKDKDVIIEENNMGPVLLTHIVPFGAGSQKEKDGEMNTEANANANIRANANFSQVATAPDNGDAIPAVLPSEEELNDLLKRDSANENTQEAEGEKVDVAKRATESEESLGLIEVEEDEDDRRTLGTMVKNVEENNEGITEGGTGAEDEDLKDNKGSETLETKDQVEKSVAVSDKESEKEDISFIAGGAELVEEETDGSTDLEIPSPEYVADRHLYVPLKPVESVEVSHYTNDTMIPTKQLDPDDNDQEITMSAHYEQHTQTGKASGSEETANKLKESNDDLEERYHIESMPKGDVYLQELRSSMVLKDENRKSDPLIRGKGTKVKQKRNQQSVTKQATQSDEAQPGHGESQRVSEKSERQTTENTVQKAKRRRIGKWAQLVGMNPVQRRATLDLYPSTRLSSGLEAPAGLCDNFHCKRGRTCQLDADRKPTCVCQEPSECPRSVNTFDHVCGTDNKTYDTSCELFATKCNMEGSKRGHKLHLDYTGPCKFIAPCLDNELVQFPLRMRDWLKNVLLQLYKRDSMSPGLLSAKQRIRVKKMYENERRLHPSNHTIDQLVQDFEKNYNMYIYPVHWQFAQMDQRPSDRFLSHSELAPLRVPLVPMEHCISHFFQECDADKDKQVSFNEWTRCFGIKDDDMNSNMLF